MERRVIESGNVRVEIVKKKPISTFELSALCDGQKSEHLNELELICALQVLKSCSDEFAEWRRTVILDAVECSLFHR